MNNRNKNNLRTTVLPWLFGPGGAVVTVICAWFQTMSFTVVPLSSCLMAVIAGAALGALVMLRIYRRSKPSEEAPQNRLKLRDLDKIMQGFGIMVPLISVCGFLATTESSFLVALAGMSFGACMMSLYIIVRKLVIKQEYGN